MYKLFVILFITLVFITGCSNSLKYNGLSTDLFQSKTDTILSEIIIYHNVRVDQNGAILPWYSPDPGKSYDYVLNRVWSFWKNMELDSNRMPYYMNHQVWAPDHDKRGLGGDQIMMALSSWDLYYNYTGDESIIDNMKFMANYYLKNSLSSPDCKWPNLPFPYNMDVERGIYDGDMILGKGFLQPDKAGSFGFELLKLYKKTGDKRYLSAAEKIANTLAAEIKPGDNENSPWPFKVNAKTGETGILVDQVSWYEGMPEDLKKSNSKKAKSAYTTNYVSTLELFSGLIKLQNNNSTAYKKAFDITLEWLKSYPAKTNKWGPFFEDIPRWSDTQINAITYAMYLIEHPELDVNWKETVNHIFKWVHDELGDNEFEKYGVTCIDEQTAYRVPGNSHSSRQASVELMYWEKTGDTTYVRNAIRMLNWATYMVDNDGKNLYPTNGIWMTDGYGDYVRHYLRAMAAAPQLVPSDANHLLKTSSIVTQISYKPLKINYTTFDSFSEETFRLIVKPKSVKVNGLAINEMKNNSSEGWSWQPLDKGGIFKIKQSQGNTIEIKMD